MMIALAVYNHCSPVAIGKWRMADAVALAVQIGEDRQATQKWEAALAGVKLSG